jgi:adenine deaminase
MPTADELARRIVQARGEGPADLVVRGARYLDVVSGDLVRAEVAVCGDTIVGVEGPYEAATVVDGRDLVLVPGFVDTHLHVESSLIAPGEFDRAALPRGTTTAVCDPHEIANVLGLDGVRYFLEAAEGVAMDLRVQLSSCVPATDHLETSGARLTAADLLTLKDHPKALGLAEFMNVPGVLHRDPEALAKLAAFSDRHVDGHAPLVTGRDLDAYLACGIRTCHETTRADEGREKLRKGMQVLIRGGSAAFDVPALAPLLDVGTSPFLAFCTDDRNPLDIREEGHLDHAIRTALALGAPPAAVYRAASWSGARAFGLRDRGLIAPGRRADIVLLSDYAACRVAGVVAAGRPVGPGTFEGRRLPEPAGRGSVRLDPVDASVFAMPGGPATLPVIGVVPRRIITERQSAEIRSRGGLRLADPSRDLLKVAVLARHGTNRNVGRAFVRGFGLAEGALASSVGHDSHNVIVVGADDADMAAAVNRLIELQGGFVAARGGRVVAELPLPLAGLMSDRPHEEVADALAVLRDAVRAMGCALEEPFLQLAFLPLPVIPHLKITDRGLVDVDRFELVTA